MTAMPLLFDALTLRSVTLTHRLLLSPMCQYSAVEGCATDWHFVHYGQLAMGGAGMVMLEATSIEARGRHCCWWLDKRCSLSSRSHIAWAKQWQRLAVR